MTYLCLAAVRFLNYDHRPEPHAEGKGRASLH